MNSHLVQNGFERNISDHCMYRRQTENETVIVIILVDDLIIAASKNDLLNNNKYKMQSQFNMKDLGKISCFLGIQFKQRKREIKMNQTKYIKVT